MPFLPLPPSAAWAHRDARSGFEVVYFQALDDGHLLTGATTAVEDGQSWIVDYEIQVDVGWRTLSARVTGRSTTGARTRLLESDGQVRAAYVRALDLSVERLEQQYTRTADQHGHQRYDYTAPAFDFSCQLVYDEAGLVLAYPGIAVRAF